MMDLRKKLFIIIGIFVGLILALLLWILAGRQDKESSTPINETPIDQTNIPAPAVREPVGFIAPPPELGQADSQAEPDDIYLRQIATIFTERFNSYSNQNNNTHLGDAIALSTDKMVKWLKSQKLEQESIYSAVITDVITANIEEKDDNYSIVLVDLKEVKEGNGGGEEIYRTAKVELVKIGSVWKVDGFFWEEN